MKNFVIIQCALAYERDLTLLVRRILNRKSTQQIGMRVEYYASQEILTKNKPVS